MQGVFFRASTERRASELGLVGHALNLADGRVEVVASGAPEALAALQAWLHTGPPSARVDTVEREELAVQDHIGFTTR